MAALKYDLEQLTDWFRANKLSLNVSKTNYMVFSNMKINTHDIVLKIGNEQIEQLDHIKFLGIIIDSKLNWNKHLHHCKNKLSSGLYALKTVKHLLPLQHLKSLYYTMIHPYLTYGTMLWGSSAKQFINPIQILQNKAVRNITNSKYNEHVPPLYKSLKISPIEKLYKIHLAKFMYQHHNKQLPQPLQALYAPNTDTHQHNTRYRHHPHIVRLLTNQVNKTFLHQAPEFWYSLPDNIKESRTIKQLKNRVTIHLGY